MKESILIGSDHAGFELKEKIKSWLEEAGYTPGDEGCYNLDSVHYPEFGKKVAQKVANDPNQRGILICGTGIGMSITANRFNGVRGTLVHDETTARMSREHNNSNLLILGARVVSEEQAKTILHLWLETPFEGGRHQTRLNLIEE